MYLMPYRSAVQGMIRRAALAAFAFAWVASTSTVGALAQGAFYRPTEEELRGPPGTVIRQEPMLFARLPIFQFGKPRSFMRCSM
jgi:hypothetical protein